MERVTFKMHGQTVGYENPQEKPEAIIGGTEAPEGVDLSAQVSFVYNFSDPILSYHCYGTAIGPNLILTTAHCLEKSDNVSAIWVRIGGRDLREQAEANVQIQKVIVSAHPEVTDLALVYVDYNNLSYVPIISPLDTAAREMISMYGYGDTNEALEGSQISPVPKFVDLYQEELSFCEDYATEGEACFSDDAHNINNVGHGDSGGPVLQWVTDANGTIYRALRGVITKTDPVGNNFTIINDLRLPPNRNFIRDCIELDAKTDTCQVLYDRNLPNVVQPPNLTQDYMIENIHGNNDLSTALLAIALAAGHTYRWIKK